MHTVHILNGDILLDQIQHIEGDKIVFRECMIDGPVEGEDLPSILKNRMSFFQDVYDVSPEEYNLGSIQEISRILTLPSDIEICMWFEYDLFCQIHFWCVVAFLSTHNKIYLVSPNHDDWTGFGSMDASALSAAYDDRGHIGVEEITWIKDMWLGFQSGDFEKMRLNAIKLGHVNIHIEEVVEAHIERFPAQNGLGRPEKRLLAIMEELETKEFGAIFKAFSTEEGIYGFGDVQIRNILANLTA